MGHAKDYIRVSAMSFEDAALYTFMENVSPFIVISIDDRGFAPTPLNTDNPKLMGVLKLWFFDRSYDDEGNIPEFAMTEEDAEKIIKFVKYYLPWHPEIVVHCAAGVSRSAGVAAALCRWLNGDDSPIMSDPHRAPNLLCYTRVLDAAKVDYDLEHEFERFRKQREDRRKVPTLDDLWDRQVDDPIDFDCWADEEEDLRKGWENMIPRLAERFEKFNPNAKPDPRDSWHY